MPIEKIQSVDADTLLSTPMEKTRFVVDGLIPQGLGILAGSAKIGKSWLMLWLGLQVAQGKPVWCFSSHTCDVLYLCLEDTYPRIQSRLYQLTDEAPENLRIATTVFQIGSGLEEQLEQFLSDFPDTRLVIIDTFQKVRNPRSAALKTGMYAGDYEDMSALKGIADQFGIALMVVHHIRKMEDKNDPFNQMTGSTGITGAADSSYILTRNRTSDTGTLLATGRDIQYQELTLRFNPSQHIWEFVERKDSDELQAEAVPDFLFALVDFIRERTFWSGTATQLLTEMQETETAPTLVTKYLARFSEEFLRPSGVRYKTKRTGKQRLILLSFQPASDSDDANDGKSSI